MPESNFSQTSLRELVHDAESQLESLSRALDNLKSTVRRLSAQVAMSDGASPGTGSGYGFGRPSAETPPAPEEKPFDFSAAAAAFSQELAADTPSISHQRPIATPPEAPARPESEWYGVSDGGSWPVGPKHADTPPATPPLRDSDALSAPEESTSDDAEAVAALEEPVAAATGSEWDFDPPVTQDEALTPLSTEAVAGDEDTSKTENAPAPAQATEQPKRSLSSGWPDEGIWSQSFDWPAMRATGAPAPAGDAGAPKDDFRSMVDQVRAEIEAARASGETIDMDIPGEDESDDEAAKRAEVQRMVEEMRARAATDDEELDASFEPEVTNGESTEASEDDDEAKREEARRAVEQMRAEMTGSGRVSFDPPAKPAPSLDWSHMQAESSGPPVLVVKDTDGRVELANVYDLLNRLECGESAALLNYTPHSVTVGLPIQAPTPTVDSVTTAVMAVFGRSGVVDTDGARITVQMGTDANKKRSEDAA